MRHPNHRRPLLPALLASGALLASPGAPAQPPAEAPFAAEEGLQERIDAVNEGDLRFLATPPAGAVHHHINQITVSGGSLADGWVALDQCHLHLDPVPRLEVIFHRDRIRDLAVVSAQNIERAWVEGASVQLEGVGRGARLCLSARSRALQRQEDGTLVLHNGPYMRRFLDGYYPMRITTQISLPQGAVEVLGLTPPDQPGFKVQVTGDHVLYDGWFEGRLETDLMLLPRGGH